MNHGGRTATFTWTYAAVRSVVWFELMLMIVNDGTTEIISVLRPSLRQLNLAKLLGIVLTKQLRFIARSNRSNSTPQK
jgi:hypothetical protein